MNNLIRKYRAVVQSRGGLRRTLNRHGIVRMMDAGLREAWISFGICILRAFGRQPGKDYGWFEAVLFPTCEYWLRYAQVVKGLEAAGVNELQRLVEVSSGRGGIGWVFRRTDLQTCLVDRSLELLQDSRGGNAWRVCADACRLPFADDSFDAAVSLDTVEHLPKELRGTFLQELKRIAKRAVVITCPIQSADGEYQGRDFDLRLQREISERKGVQPEWLEEHIERGHPTREELSEELPGADIKGAETCSTWLRFHLLSRRVLFWLFSGVFYQVFLKKRQSLPPYRRALLVWRKPTRSDLCPVPETANQAEKLGVA